MKIILPAGSWYPANETLPLFEDVRKSGGKLAITFAPGVLVEELGYLCYQDANDAALWIIEGWYLVRMEVARKGRFLLRSTVRMESFPVVSLRVMDRKYGHPEHLFSSNLLGEYQKFFYIEE